MKILATVKLLETELQNWQYSTIKYSRTRQTLTTTLVEDIRKVSINSLFISVFDFSKFVNQRESFKAFVEVKWWLILAKRRELSSIELQSY